MQLKTALRITRVCAALALLFLFLWLLFKTQTLLYLCLGASFAVLASKAVFYRCPHCRRYLHRVYGKCCPYCGKELGL